MPLSYLLVVGSINIDLLMRVPRIPGAGETVLGADMMVAEGGKGANQAVAAARAGASVKMKGCVGRDPFGRRLVDSLRRAGVDSGGVRSVDLPTGAASIWVVPGGENRIAVAPGANRAVTPDLIRQWSPAIAGADLLLLQLEIPPESVSEALAIARQAGVRVMLDPAPVPDGGLPRDVLSGTFLLTPNREEVSALTGMNVDDPATAEVAGRLLVQQGTEVVCITLGMQGAVLVTGDGALWFPGFHVEAVDGTAAGDAFNGALAALLLEGARIDECLRAATAAGALAATVAGAQPSLPVRADVQRLLDDRRECGWPRRPGP